MLYEESEEERNRMQCIAKACEYFFYFVELCLIIRVIRRGTRGTLFATKSNNFCSILRLRFLAYRSA